MEVERVSSVFFLFNSISYLINSCRNEHALFLIFKFNLFRLNLTGAIPIVEIWMNLLTSFPKWNVEKNILYLLDILARTAWMDPVSSQSCRRILSVVLQESDKVHRPSKGLVSRVGNWVSGSSEALGHLDATELILPSPTFPYLSWVVMELEFERHSKMRQFLVVEFYNHEKLKVSNSL